MEDRDINGIWKPRISPDLKLMPEEISYPEWGKLKQHVEAKNKK